MVAIQKGHLCCRLDPHLVLGILRENVERGHVQAELFGARELAHVGAHRVQLVASDAVGHLEHALAGVTGRGEIETADWRAT